MKLYLIRRGVYYECTQVSEHVYATRIGHIHTHNDFYLSQISQVFTDQWEALRFMYQYHVNLVTARTPFYRGMHNTAYRLPYSVNYIKRHLLTKFPEDFL